MNTSRRFSVSFLSFVFATGMLVGIFAMSALSLLSANTDVAVENKHSFWIPSLQERRASMLRTTRGGLQRDMLTSYSQDGISAGHASKEGWNQVQVFYGDESLIEQASQISSEMIQSRKWFGQSQQDEFVSRLLKFKRNGFFVDLAANDAVRISNTYALEKHFGWKGLCIEANPLYWNGLAHRPGCQVIAAVVGRTMMEKIQFKFPNRAAPKGGIVGFDNKSPSKFGEDQLRYTVTLEHILDRFGAPNDIDYLSLDVEGAETFVMESFPFDRYRFRVVSIERPDDALCRLLVKNKYRFLKRLTSWGETVWVHEELISEENSVDLSVLAMDTEHYHYSEKA